MLAYFITKGPATLYRLSRDTPYSISTVYKKAKRMVKDCLIKAIDSNGDRSIYDVTVKGLLVCLAHGCVDDELVLIKLRSKWGLKGYDVDKLIALLSFIPYVVKYGNEGILDNVESLMIILSGITSSMVSIGKSVDEHVMINAKDASIYFIISNIIMNGLSQNTKPDIIIGNNFYLVGYCKRENAYYVYMCRLCTKNCLLTHVPSTSHCRLATEVSKDVGIMVR